ncbi:MAG: MerR family transcriptional regulator [Thermodesulfobacteriota bacterium]
MKLYSYRTIIEIVGITPTLIKRLEEAEVLFPMVEDNEIYYTERDIRKLFLAKDLQEMGVNLAGIEVILEISDRMFNMKKETDDVIYKLFKYIDKSIGE